MSTKIMWIGLSAAGGLLMAGAGVGPEDAVSNLSQWATVLGLSDVAKWLEQSQADTWVLKIGIAIASFSFAMFLQPYFSRKPTLASRGHDAEEGSSRPTRGAYLVYLEMPEEKMFLIQDIEWEHHLLNKDNPQIVLNISAINAHYHSVVIKGVSGNFKYAGNDIPGQIDWRGNDGHTSYGDTITFSVRQWVPKSDATRILEAAQTGRHVALITRFVEILASAYDPTTAQHVRDFRVFTPDQLQFDSQNHWRLQPTYRHQAAGRN